MVDTWTTLVKELKFYGIDLLDSKRCVVRFDGSTPTTQGVFKTIRQINSVINSKKKTLLLLWKEMGTLLLDTSSTPEPIDQCMEKLFIFCLKDMINYLLCFEDLDHSQFHNDISRALSRDIRSFTKNQIYKIPEYKISIDFTHRTITRLLYIKKMLTFVLMGRKKIDAYDMKMASGVSGPWSRLDLPMEERVFPFGTELEERSDDKKKQRRYRKGLENYSGGGVGEGFYWRELRNEPFTWDDRSFDDPYPRRNLLNR
jgi:hypothetical protein